MKKKYMSLTGSAPPYSRMFKKQLIFLPRAAPVRKAVRREDVDVLAGESSVGQDASAKTASTQDILHQKSPIPLLKSQALTVKVKRT